MGRLYLVDDHTIVRDGLRSVLHSGGHSVVGEAAAAKAALQGVLQATPDVLLLDLALDGGSGFELLAELHKRALPLKTLVLTMSLQPRDVAEALRLGAAGYLLKDSSRAELLAAIDAVLQGRRHLGPQVAELAAQALVEQPADDPLHSLSPRERQIITLVVSGHSSAAVGERLNLSPKTVDTYRSRLMAKLGVADVTGLVRFALRAGLIDTR